jgi:protein tyrosine/serine phosphatase
MGLFYYSVPMSSGAPPSRATLEKLVDLYESIDEPLLIHCKTGADRTGLAAGIYHLAVLGSVTSIAKKQLDIRFLHLGLGKKKLLRIFFDFHEKTNPDHIPFKVWLQSTYTKDRFMQFLSCADFSLSE